MENDWSLPIIIDSVCHINNAGVFLIGVAEHFSINKKGYHYRKRCVTHDFSFPGPKGILVNKRVLKDTLQPCLFGFFFFRILHTIADMRIKWTSKIILINNTDIDAEYHHIHAIGCITSTCITIVYNLTLLFLLLPFGMTPATVEYTRVSKAEINLGNDLLREKSQDAT